MSDLTVDDETLETGDRVSIFIIASDLMDLVKECDNTPLHPEEELIEIGVNCFRRGLIVGASDLKGNGIVFIPWNPVKNALAISKQKTSPVLGGAFFIPLDTTKNARAISQQETSPTLNGVYSVESDSCSKATDLLRKTFGFPSLSKSST